MRQHHIATSKTAGIHTTEYSLVASILKKRTHTVSAQRQGNTMPLAYQLHHLGQKHIVGQCHCRLT